jgi:hypothetical protein
MSRVVFDAIISLSRYSKILVRGSYVSFAKCVAQGLADRELCEMLLSAQFSDFPGNVAKVLEHLEFMPFLNVLVRVKPFRLLLTFPLNLASEDLVRHSE